MANINEFVERVHSLFPDFLELIPNCKKKIYITTVCKLFSEIHDVSCVQEYYCYYDYNSLDILFYPWREFESAK